MSTECSSKGGSTEGEAASKGIRRVSLELLGELLCLNRGIPGNEKVQERVKRVKANINVISFTTISAFGEQPSVVKQAS